MSPESPHHGSDARSARTGTAQTAAVRLALVARSTRSASISISRPREQPAWPNDQDNQKSQMPGKDLPRRRERGPDGLGNAKENATGQRTPHAAKPTDNHGLERQDQPDRPGCRIKDCANR